MSRARDFADLAGSANAGGLTGRNLVINGAMKVAQRGTSFADPSDDTYTLDRMHVFNSNDGATTITQDTTVPSGEGFYNSIKFDCTTIDGTIAAGQYLSFNQRIEGLNNAVLGYGASGAKSIVVSFYAKSNLTGTFCYNVRNSALNRSYIKEFSLASANTWERISFTIPGDTSGTWLTTNGIGALHEISLSMGSTYHGTANQWNTSNVVATSNQVNFLSSTDNEFFLTGWQVEVGQTATPFEHEDYGTTLRKCQRYYYQVAGIAGGAVAYATQYADSHKMYSVYHPQSMRAIPLATVTGDNTPTEYKSYQSHYQAYIAATSNQTKNLNTLFFNAELQMNITSAQYTRDPDDTENVGISFVLKGETYQIVLGAVGNRHYEEIMRQVDAGTLTIADAD